jgi:hypothetical protein
VVIGSICTWYTWIVPQLSLYIDDKLRKSLEDKARARGVSLSRYVAQLLERDLAQQSDWPPGYFEEVLGGWKGDLERPPQGKEEVREEL